MPPAARQRMGNALRLREQAREPWTVPAIETFAQDVRHALRLFGYSEGELLGCEIEQLVPDHVRISHRRVRRATPSVQ